MLNILIHSETIHIAEATGVAWKGFRVDFKCSFIHGQIPVFWHIWMFFAVFYHCAVLRAAALRCSINSSRWWNGEVTRVSVDSLLSAPTILVCLNCLVTMATRLEGPLLSHMWWKGIEYIFYTPKTECVTKANRRNEMIHSQRSI